MSLSFLENSVYETEESLFMYLDLHFPSSGGGSSWIAPMIPHDHAPIHALRFPQRVAQLLVQLEPTAFHTALDVGCAVGGTSFELAKTFHHVHAFDYSERFIDAAKRMQTEEQVPFSIRVEGDISVNVVAVHEAGVTQAVREKITFFQGDACQIPETLLVPGKQYNAVVMANLLCRLPDPEACLNGLKQIVVQGGVVLLVTPFTWLEQFTPRDKWIGGSQNTPSSVNVLETMMTARGFCKIHDEEMPLLIREHQRKYQYIVSKATGWRKL